MEQYKAMIKGFEKIKVVETVKNNKPAKTRKPSKFLRFFAIGIIVVLIIVAVFGISVYFPGKDLYLSVQKTMRVANETAATMKAQDLGSADSKLKELNENLADVQKNLNRLLWVRRVPVLGEYVSDADHFVKAGIAGVEAGQITVETVLPYSDLLGLKGKSTFVAGSADERIRTAVETLDKIVPNIDKIADKIKVVQQELEAVNMEKYPEKIGSTEIRARLVSTKGLFDSTASLFVEARPLLKQLPELLGVRSAKRYLMIFQNDAELRATGGFITAYGIFKVEKGKIQVEKADDIYKLDDSKTRTFPAPSPILKYHKNVTNLQLRDSNLSPDFGVSMDQFRLMLKESVSSFPSFDGIIALDTHVLVSTIKILGDFNVYGRVFSADNDKRCDCPKAIYELEDYSTKPVAYVREDRKDIISVLLYQIMQKALGISPSKYWGKLSQMFLDEAKQKHLIFNFNDTEAQKGIEALDFGGKIQSFDGDYLHLSNVNFAGAKSNLFVREAVKQEYAVAGDGTITKTVTVTYKNPSPASNCNLEAGQLCLNGILRNWVRLYVPSGSKLVEFTGSEMDTVTYDELGKTVFEGFMTVKPQGAAEIKVKYTLPMKGTKGSTSKLLTQKQPGTDAPVYSVVVNGREIENLPLLSDRVTVIKW